MREEKSQQRREVEAPNVDLYALLVTCTVPKDVLRSADNQLVAVNFKYFAFETTRMNISTHRLWRLEIPIWASSKEDATSRSSV
jgi:hypothetical protein